MSNLENVLKDVLYGSVGAVATVVEKTGEIARALVNKGEETLRENQDVTDELVRKGEEVTKAASEAMEKACRDLASAFKNVDAMTPEERAELRRRLDELDAAAAKAADAAAEAAREAEEAAVEAAEAEAAEADEEAGEDEADG